jgi:PHD/YefM family antitoxin component YafN of YafNO toxin-antitoxin module
MVSLPHWAVAAIAKADIHTLLDRCEHETLLIEHGDQPSVVMMSHEEWRRLIGERNAARRETPDDSE